MRAANVVRGAALAVCGLSAWLGGGLSLARAESGPAPLDEAAFRALVEGRTVHYTLDGEFYGSESFPGGERAIWRDPDGVCEDGVWRAYGFDLCFRYDRVSCWRVYEAEEGGRYAVSTTGLRVDFFSIEDAPMDCAGVPLS